MPKDVTNWTDLLDKQVVRPLLPGRLTPVSGATTELIGFDKCAAWAGGQKCAVIRHGGDDAEPCYYSHDALTRTISFLQGIADRIEIQAPAKYREH